MVVWFATVVAAFSGSAMARQTPDDAQISLSVPVIDKTGLLNSRYQKVRRERTLYIIIHTSEAGLASTLGGILNGRRLVGDRQHETGGHAHYVIAPDGRIFYTLNHRFIANHAGQSMWAGVTDISTLSIGIELVGFSNVDLTEEQYTSVGSLIDMLQHIYRLGDLAVLTHSQVAYGNPNYWFKAHHRGRKQCARNFNRTRAGLGPTWPYDPDVKADRLLPDEELAAIFYESTDEVIHPKPNRNILVSFSEARETAERYRDLGDKKINTGKKLIREGRSMRKKVDMLSVKIESMKNLLKLVSDPPPSG